MGTPRPRFRVAVLGGTGSVGRHVCAAFARRGDEVLAVARNPARWPGPVLALDVAATPAAELADLLCSHRIDVVVNAAGGWGTTVSEMEYAHVRLVEGLIEATALMAERPRLIQLGSIHEYGPVPAGTLIDESIPPRPSTPYGRTKLAGSQAILDATQAGKVNGVVLRVVNICGPDTTPASFLGSLVQKLRSPTVSGGLELSVAAARRDFVDVRDVADAVVSAAGATEATGLAVNIGRGEAVDMRELVALLVEASGLPPRTVRLCAGQVESKGGGWTRADIRLAQRLLGWAPRIGLRESMRGMWIAADTRSLSRQGNRGQEMP